jgi:hypothetical protein
MFPLVSILSRYLLQEFEVDRYYHTDEAYNRKTTLLGVPKIKNNMSF